MSMTWFIKSVHVLEVGSLPSKRSLGWLANVCARRPTCWSSNDGIPRHIPQRQWLELPQSTRSLILEDRTKGGDKGVCYENRVVPTGLGSFFPLYPAPRRWAKMARPCRGWDLKILCHRPDRRIRFVTEAIAAGAVEEICCHLPDRRMSFVTDSKARVFVRH